MLDRYTITLNADELALVLGVEVPSDYSRQYNAAPTKSLPVVTCNQPDKLQLFHWGFMTNWAKNRTMSPKFFNIHLDSVLTKTSYRRKLASNRCIVPMDGFYLWKKLSKKKLIPHYISYPDKRVFAVAGIWEENDGVCSFSVLLKPSSTRLRELQEVMPLIMDPVTSKKWLESSDQSVHENSLYVQVKNEQFSLHTVSPRISNIKMNDSTLINPTPAVDQLGNYTLFS